MQKKLIALAAASAFTLPVMAQSSVIVYGQMDIGVASLPDEAGHDVTHIDSALWTDSYIGVKGTEDLGGGLKAVFQVETTLVNDDATGLAGEGRDTFVGLAGGFGTLIAGYLSTPLNNWLADYDANGSNTFRTSNVNLEWALEARAGNTVAYATPDLGGFQGVAFYSVDETYDVPVNIK
ncbi:MAG: porin, partial [Rhodocyclaceae bacterium]|nr:porin [Rhodocyclaceae bacterium]